MLKESVAQKVLEISLSTGGDFAEIFVENTVRNSISQINGVVENAIFGVDFGCGIRVFNGNTAIYTYTNDISEENLYSLAKETADAISNSNKVVIPTFSRLNVDNLHKVIKMPNTSFKKETVDLLRLASETSFAYNPLITQTDGRYMDVVQDVLIVNSEGLWATDRRVRSRVSISSIASSGSEKQSSTFSPGATKGFELFDNINVVDIAKKTAKSAVEMLKAEECPSGKMCVVIDNGFGGVIFHEACGHSLEATGVAKGASVFAGKMGERIASPIVTAIDDGTIPNAWGSINIDDEGIKTRKNVLIEDGILKSYLVDKLNGRKMGMNPTGSSRRESYKFAPTSRMTNTYIASGKDKPEEIIASTEYGLYAKEMGGGSVETSTGDFNFAVNEGYIIRNGKIAEPVRGATLIGKGSEILMNIDKVADNMLMGAGVCGSLSGSVPTNVGQPMIRVKEITVGGRK